MGFADTSTAETRRFPLDLHSVLNGLLADNDYLKPIFPSKLLELWISIKREEAVHVYHAPTPEEYELYFNC